MKKKSTAAFLMGLVALPAAAQFRPGHRFALTPGQVAQALSVKFAERGIRVAGEQVSLPARVVATSPDPLLEITSIEPLGNLDAKRSGQSSSAVKLVCHGAGTCLPFYAIVTWPDGYAPDATTPKAASFAPHVSAPKPADIVLKAGARSTLLLGDESMQVQISVISLQSGAVGQTVRVTSPDRKHTYTAEIVSADLLKGSL